METDYAQEIASLSTEQFNDLQTKLANTVAILKANSVTSFYEHTEAQWDILLQIVPFICRQHTHPFKDLGYMELSRLYIANQPSNSRLMRLVLCMIHGMLSETKTKEPVNLIAAEVTQVIAFTIDPQMKIELSIKALEIVEAMLESHPFSDSIATLTIVCLTVVEMHFNLHSPNDAAGKSQAAQLLRQIQTHFSTHQVRSVLQLTTIEKLNKLEKHLSL
jgi:hypothetical protein